MKKTLPDLGFMVLPYIANHYITDVYIHLLFVIVLVRIWFTPHAQTAYRRFFWISGGLYLFRSLTISFTILPTPYSGCTLEKHDSPFFIALKVVLGQHSTCGDVLYSGHTMILTSSALLWQLYTHNFILKIAVWIFSVIGMLIIVATHFHYSDDVVIALLLTLFGYTIYHWGLWIGKIHRDGGNVPFYLFGELMLLIDGTDCIPIKETKLENDDIIYHSAHTYDPFIIDSKQPKEHSMDFILDYIEPVNHCKYEINKDIISYENRKSDEFVFLEQ